MLADSTAPAHPRVLAIGLADPFSGAGTQAAIKAIGVGGGSSHSAVAALIAQNSEVVQVILNASGEALRLQLDSVVNNVHIDAFRVGALGTDEAGRVVAQFLSEQHAPVVFAPTLFTSTGEKKFELAGIALSAPSPSNPMW